MHFPRVPYFKLFYSSTFSILSLILIALLLIPPGDAILQAYRNDQLYNVFVIAGVYLLTFIIAILIYSTRFYTNRTNLVSIPKSWIPIDTGDVSKSVRRMILEGLARSARIAYEAHPRDLRQDSAFTVSPETKRAKRGSKTSPRPMTAEYETEAKVIPPWGIISHPGWSSPSSPDLPNLQYEPVILELPHLIEAKAVSLAPSEPSHPPATDNSHVQETQPPLPDALAVELLQRPAMMGLRDYFTHLFSIGVIDPPSLGMEFLQLYEKARFSGQALDEHEFRQLMNVFAEILRGMKELDPIIVADLHAEALSESDIDEDGVSTTETVEHTPFHTPMPDIGQFDGLSRPHREVSAGSLAGSEGTVRTAPSRTRVMQRDVSRDTGSRLSRRSNAQSSRREPSFYSLHNVRTTSTSGSSQQSGGSVIRLAEARAPLDLPYAITVPDGTDARL
ncbi:MAG: hypothetical protein Q9187_002083 [Circinaria calcarea]